MDDRFKIFVEQLRDGHIEQIQETYPSDFLDIHEKELAFIGKVVVDGEAYLANEDLILNLNISASAKLPCSICNNEVVSEIQIFHFYHSEPLAEIKGGVYNMQNILRETILLETPAFAECNQGKCPRRNDISNYLVQQNKKDLEEEGYQPFC